MDGDAPIDRKLDGLTSINAEEHCIFKVHGQLLEENKEAYKPVLLAIGPHNDHGKVGQGIMEEHKLRYLKQMLERRKEHCLKDYMEALRKLGDRVRKCYADAGCISQNTQNKDEFVEMMLLDGCFIIELFRKWKNRDLRDEHDPIFQLGWMRAKIARDLMLFENQLPYFVLTELFKMSASKETSPPNPSRHSGQHNIDVVENDEITASESSTCIDQVEPKRLEDLALSFFSDSLPFKWDVSGSSSYSTENIKHLLGPTHTTITPTLAKMVLEHLKVGDKFKNEEFKHLLDLIYTSIKLSVLDMEVDRAIERQEVGVLEKIFGLIRGVVSPLLEKPEKMKGYEKINNNDCGNEDDDWNSIIPYGTELREAGVEFEMAKEFTKFVENKHDWKSIPDAIAFQEARVKFEKAEKFKELLGQNRNKEAKKKLCGAIFMKMAEKFMRLPFLNKIEYWNPIPDGRELKEAGVEFEEAKKFTDTKVMMKPIHNATKLKEGGVEFQKAKQHKTFSINFSNGVLEIWPLRIDDETETFLRNLIAYEQYSPDIETDDHYVTHYACMMDDLITSPKDVELFCQNEIIENWLGDDEVASSMFNKLCHQVTVPDYPPRTYVETFIGLNKHYAKPWNEWMATLRRNYFSSPWALLSVLAAILLLGLTIIQTVFSIIN